MITRYKLFDPSRLKLKSLEERVSDVTPEDFILPNSTSSWWQPELKPLVKIICEARENNKPIIFFIGGHVIKSGLSLILIELMRQGWITHIAGNGAVAIHDFELATAYQTGENVQRYISEGQFGLWKETSLLNQVISANGHQVGLGEGIGHAIKECASGADLSVLAHAFDIGVPFTIHPLIGGDIIHTHSSFDGATWGAQARNDLLIFTETITVLEGGVFLSFGSAVHAPEVFLKALSAARNVSETPITNFTTAVFDIVDLPPDWWRCEPDKTSPAYYFRPLKTILQRTIQDGGKSFYFKGLHQQTLPALFNELHKISLPKTVQ